MKPVPAIDKFSNAEIARMLRKVAAAYTILGESRFKIVAYENAATSIEHSTSEVKDLFEEGKLDAVPGLGPSIRSHLSEFFSKGSSKHIEQVLSSINQAIFPLLEVPGIGPKKAEKLVKELNIKSAQLAVNELEKAAIEHKISSLETFGEKSEQDILDNIERFRKGQIKLKRMVLPLADALAQDIISYLKENCPQIERIDKLGSLRRQLATIGDLDFAVATDDFEAVIDAFVHYPRSSSIIERGPSGASILLTAGRQADLRVSKPSEYGAMLQYFTGSKYHNIKLREYALKQGYSLNEYGLSEINSSSKTKKVQTFDSEEKLYNFLGLDYISPELREDFGEIEAAKSHILPNLVKLADIRGDLHTHSDYDVKPSHDYGQNSMEEMLNEARALGYEYFGFAEHNPKATELTQSDILGILAKRKKHIDGLQEKNKGVKIINLLEVDIKPDGELAVPEDGFQYLDAAIVSVHSVFGLSKEEMTKRVVKALSYPAAKILGHPTGRLLEQREGFELDWPTIFAVCKKLDKALEINAHPSRLDLSDTLVREAVKFGVKLVIDTDSHNFEDLVNMQYGVSVARRGWAEPENVINTWKYERLIDWLKKR